MDASLQLVVDAKAALGEGPCWDARKQVLYWVDILNENLFVFDPLKNTNRCFHLDQFIGAVVPRTKGDVTLALRNGFYNFELESGLLEPINNPEPDIDSNRFNDGKCDAQGRFWAGSMDIQAVEGRGALYCLEQNHTCRKVLDNLNISNGLAWDNSNHTMYFIDSPTRKVVAYDYDKETGKIENGRPVIDLSHKKGIPDGMTMDHEGMLWIAEWGGWEVSRWDPGNGKQIQTISVPASQVSSCTFGGENLDFLYITTARTGLDEVSLIQQPHAGGLFGIQLDVRGTAACEYLG